MEEERCARVVPPSVHTRDQVELPPPAIDNRLTVHTLWSEVRRSSYFSSTHLNLLRLKTKSHSINDSECRNATKFGMGHFGCACQSHTFFYFRHDTYYNDTFLCFRSRAEPSFYSIQFFLVLPGFIF